MKVQWHDRFGGRVTNAVQIAHEARNPFPFVDLKNNRMIVDEVCLCGHLRSEHQDRFAYGYGACRCQTPLAAGVRCACPQFTWSEHVFGILAPVTSDHPKFAGCEITVFAVGVETWRADHECTDNKGRKIGGRAMISTRGGYLTLDVQITRDGIVYGASRRVSTYGTLDDARSAALEKLQRQRRQARDRYAPSPDVTPLR